MNKNTLRNIALLVGISLILASVIHIFNLWLFSLKPLISPIDATFLEGIIFIGLGILFFIGSGGINPDTRKAAMLAALADVLGKEVIGPSEVYKRDAWKPKGSIRLGLIFIITGITLVILYSISFFAAL